MKQLFVTILLVTLAVNVFASRLRDHLESYKLCELEFFAASKSGKYAMFLLPDKNTRATALLGTFVGKNSGEIVDITDNSFTVVELYLIKKGEWKEVKNTFHLVKNKNLKECE